MLQSGDAGFIDDLATDLADRIRRAESGADDQDDDDGSAESLDALLEVIEDVFVEDVVRAKVEIVSASRTNVDMKVRDNDMLTANTGQRSITDAIGIDGGRVWPTPSTLPFPRTNTRAGWYTRQARGSTGEIC